MKKIILLNTLLFSSLIWCQVNTESMREENLSRGIHQKMDLSFSYISGISEIMVLKGDYRIDYQSKSNWNGFFVTKYDRAFENCNRE